MVWRQLIAEIVKIAKLLAWDSSIMVAAGICAQVLNYLYHLVMAVLLRPVEYGVFLSITSLLAIFTVFNQTITLTVANLTVRLDTADRPSITKYLWCAALKRVLLFGIVLFVLLAGFSPLIAKFLQSQASWGVLMLSFCSFFLAFPLAGNYGVLQGLQRFGIFGLGQVLLMLLRLAVGLAMVNLGYGLLGSLTAFPLSYLVVFLFTTFAILGLLKGKSEKAMIPHAGGYSGLTLVALLSLFALVNVDVILATHYLCPAESGKYAAVAVLGRIAYYAPAGIAMAMFPKTTAEFVLNRHGHWSIFLVAILLCTLIVGVVCLVYALWPTSVIKYLIANRYPSAAPFLFLYSLGMACLSVAHLVMIYLVSVGKTQVACPLVLSALLKIVLILYFHTDISQIVRMSFLAGLVSLVSLVPLVCWRRK